jgi:riboflavin kinase/FMN adenylyltransferase
LHLFDFDRDIYGSDIEVRFLCYLRPEQKFASLAALRGQIACDVDNAQRCFEDPAHFEAPKKN